MRILALSSLTLLSCAAALLPPRTAAACGGCFHGADESAPSVVTGHRMALSVSPTRTVLWDQVQYAGDPKDFAWVLPVGPGATIEASSDAWFESLEAVSATHVMSSTITCNGRDVRQTEGSFGGGCSGGTRSTADVAAPRETSGTPMREGSDPGVSVEHEGTVGPYETVTLKANDATSLHTWLTSHGYAVPTDIDPVIDAYVAAGSEFIALRLAPGAGVKQMTPVRVVTPGASPVLPLRMVAAGTGANVSIVLYVISEGRYAAQNFPAADVPVSDLSWDWASSSSNYAELRDQALSKDGFLTSFVASKAFTATVQTPDGEANYRVGADQAGYDNLTDLYFAQAAADENEPDKCGGISDEVATASSLVQETCATGDGCIAATKFECGGFTDIAAALTGMHPPDVWITRLEANLSRPALADDLVLEAASSQIGVSSWHTASESINLPCDPNAPPPDDADSTASTDDDSGGFCLCNMRPVLPNTTAALSSAVALLFAARRARRYRKAHRGRELTGRTSR